MHLEIQNEIDPWDGAATRYAAKLDGRAVEARVFRRGEHPPLGAARRVQFALPPRVAHPLACASLADGSSVIVVERSRGVTLVRLSEAIPCELGLLLLRDLPGPIAALGEVSDREGRVPVPASLDPSTIVVGRSEARLVHLDSLRWVSPDQQRLWARLLGQRVVEGFAGMAGYSTSRPNRAWVEALGGGRRDIRVAELVASTLDPDGRHLPTLADLARRADRLLAPRLPELHKWLARLPEDGAGEPGPATGITVHAVPLPAGLDVPVEQPISPPASAPPPVRARPVLLTRWVIGANLPEAAAEAETRFERPSASWPPVVEDALLVDEPERAAISLTPSAPTNGETPTAAPTPVVRAADQDAPGHAPKSAPGGAAQPAPTSSGSGALYGAAAATLTVAFAAGALSAVVAALVLRYMSGG